MDDLAHRLAADVSGTFPELVELIGGRLFSGLRRITGNRAEAEDLTQEALIRAYKALNGYPKHQIETLRVEAWMWTIALNLGRNHIRDRARRPTPVAEVEMGSIDPDPTDDLVWDSRLGRLAIQQRRAVVLRHVVGLGTGEISEITGRPEGTVKADIHRALEKLRNIMEEER